MRQLKVWCVGLGLMGALSGISASGQVSHDTHLPTDMQHVPDFAVDPSHPLVVGGAPSAWTVNDVVVIPAGTSLTYTTAAAYTIVVEGSLTCNSSVNTSLTVTTIVTRGSGTYVCQPAFAVNATITFPNTPIDTVFDPEQWGHGILGLGGTIRLKGVSKHTFVRLAAEPLVGQTVLLVAEPIIGWRVGDMVRLPDTREVNNGEVVVVDDRYRKSITQTETRTITAISGSQITLNAPLAFTHTGARDWQGVLKKLPHLANLSRNFVIRSANPTGVRGHMVFAHRADVGIEYVRIEEMGRTRADLLDSSTFNGHTTTHIGANQIGRYPIHAHHLIGPTVPTQDGQFRFVGNAVDSGEKWCAAIHDSHFGVVQDNVLTNCIGAGLVFETGQETGNRVTHNFIVHTPGSTTVGRDVQGLKGDIGLEGFSLWFGGVGTDNAIHDNVGADGIIGVNFPPPVSDFDPFLKCPIGPGVDPRETSVVCRPGDAPLRDFVGNEFYAHLRAGVVIWNVDRRLDKPALIDNLTIWHVAGNALGLANPGRITLNHVSIYGSYAFARNNYWPGFETTGLFVSGVTQLFLNDLTIANTMHGMRVDQPSYAPPVDVLLLAVNECDIRHNQAGVVYTRHNNDLMLSVPLKVTFKDCVIDGSPALALRLPYRGSMDVTTSVRFLIENYQHVTGNTFEVFTPQSAPEAPMPNTGTFIAPWGQALTRIVGAPISGLTNQQAWDRFGVAYAGRVAPCATTRQGIEGFACPVSGIAQPVSPPKPIPQPTRCQYRESVDGGLTWTVLGTSCR